MNIINGIWFTSVELIEILRRETSFHRVRPLTSTLFLTYRCNSRCSTCTLWKRPAEEETAREIGFEHWKIIIDKLSEAGINTTELFGGNVLLRKELLIKVLEYMHSKGFIIHLPTNQIGLDDEVAEAIASFVHSVYISTDGVGEYQDSIRGQKGAAERSWSTVERLLKLRKNSKPRLVCNTTVSKYNVNILEKIAEYALKHHFDEIHYEYAGEFTVEQIERSRINGLKPTPYYIRQDESILVDSAGARLLKESLRKIKEKYAPERLKVSTINIDSMSEENLYKGTIPHKRCYVVRNEVTVDPGGNMIICPFINNYVMGNLVERPFDETWNNKRHHEFLKVMSNGMLDMCTHCILGAQRNPGVLTSLKRIYLKMTLSS